MLPDSSYSDYSDEPASYDPSVDTSAAPEQSDSAYGQEMDRLQPVMRDKIKNFMTAIAGPAPDENTQEQAQQMFTDALGFDPELALHHYVKYKQSNPIHRQLTNLAVRQAVNSNADSYVNKILTQKMPYWENIVRPQDSTMSRSPQSESIASYQRSMLANLRKLLQDKNARDAVIKHLMDYRTLEQPVPFVQSKINYQPEELSPENLSVPKQGGMKYRRKGE